jgi:copper transport protein
VKRLFGLLVVAIGMTILALQPGVALGHAALVRSDPEANAYLQRPPTQVSITFSEPIDSRSSTLQVLDASGQPISYAPVGYLTFSSDGLSMQRSFNPLNPGIYNVLWNNVSSTDGHALAGSFPFTVLEPDGSLPGQVNTVRGLSTGNDPPPLSDGVAVRWLSLLGMLIVVAGAVLVLLWPEAGPATRGFNRMIVLGAAVLFAAALLNLFVLRDAYAGRSTTEILFHTRSGGYLLARIGAAVFVGIAALLLETRRAPACAALIGIAVFGWGLAATSHGAAGTGSVWGIAFDLVHRFAAVGWIGSVIGLAVAARMSGRNGAYRQLLPRFSLLSSILVYVLLATGALAAFIEVDRWNQFTATRYGTTLLVKLALIAPLLAVGYYNSRWGKKRLVARAPGEPRRFIATAALEAGLGLVVFVAASMLTQTTTAKAVVDTPNTKPYDTTQQVADLSVGLKVDPNRTGLNTYQVTLTDSGGQPVSADRVRLTFRYQAIGPSTLILAPAGAGVSTGQGPYLTLEGNWRVEVEVRRPNVDDVVGFFDVRPAGTAVNNTGRGSAWDNPAPGLSVNQYAGFATVLVGLGFALWGGRLKALNRWAGRAATGVTVSGFAVGILLLFGVHTHPLDPAVSQLKNPIFPDQNSISIGRQLFEQNCSSCHGLNGVPPKGLDLNPYPFDLTVHVPLHPDGQLYTFISGGVPGTAMRAWSAGDGKLTSDQIWHLVNYIRTLTPMDK